MENLSATQQLPSRIDVLKRRDLPHRAATTSPPNVTSFYNTPECPYREHELQQHVDDNARSECHKRFCTRSCKLTRACRQTYAEETKINIHVIRSLIGATEVGFTSLLKSA